MAIETAGECRIEIRQFDDIAMAVEKAMAVAARVGLNNAEQCMIGTSVSELATNVCRYADQGFMVLRRVGVGGRIGIEVVVVDKGPGIADVEAAMRDNFSTGKSLGLGLPGTRRMMDVFEISSEVGRGTRVSIRKWKS